jgi:hypothetical protein
MAAVRGFAEVRCAVLDVQTQVGEKAFLGSILFWELSVFSFGRE